MTVTTGRCAANADYSLEVNFNAESGAELALAKSVLSHFLPLPPSHDAFAPEPETERTPGGDSRGASDSADAADALNSWDFSSLVLLSICSAAAAKIPDQKPGDAPRLFTPSDKFMDALRTMRDLADFYPVGGKIPFSRWAMEAAVTLFTELFMEAGRQARQTGA